MADRKVVRAVIVGISAAFLVGLAPSGTALASVADGILACSHNSAHFDKYTSCTAKPTPPDPKNQQDPQNKAPEKQNQSGQNPMCAGTPLAATPLCAQPG
ncbi:hypothetical protein ACIBCN_28430 [Nocardia sp. NPDC051052]|uniref:hypothetical protein n=1 Tax=Nocardia sp. NPDC051052 TaxID=3364322 RepID=UPI00379BD4B2